MPVIVGAFLLLYLALSWELVRSRSDIHSDVQLIASPCMLSTAKFFNSELDFLPLYLSNKPSAAHRNDHNNQETLKAGYLQNTEQERGGGGARRVAKPSEGAFECACGGNADTGVSLCTSVAARQTVLMKQSETWLKGNSSHQEK